MSIIDLHYPVITINTQVSCAEFIDRCTQLANDKLKWVVERNRMGCDTVLFHVVFGEDRPYLRMTESPFDSKPKIIVDYVFESREKEASYDEFTDECVTLSKKLLLLYNREYGTRLRLVVPHKPMVVDLAAVDHSLLNYVLEKLSEALATILLHPDDVRGRLGAAGISLLLVAPGYLPKPLDSDLRWIHEQLTHREARYEKEGRLTATLSKMRKSTGVKIVERIIELRDACLEIKKRIES